MCACSVEGSVSATEREGLRELYEQTGGPSWIHGASGADQWLLDFSTCNWYGMTCDAGGNVIGVALSGNDLVGTLPADLAANLPKLQKFDAHFNQLTGAIPAVTGLTDLQQADVSFNQLTGTIPDLSGLTNLRQVHAQSIRGSISDGRTLGTACDKRKGHTDFRQTDMLWTHADDEHAGIPVNAKPPPG